ncbi:ATP-binding protein [Marinilactibacillus sp. GCM10026970]|uniref:ATP-binding protein n=1 Tax=Marinilactibacillus sp. GCM10026970 TaxID=3252642 RepID=UPI00361992AB
MFEIKSGVISKAQKVILYGPEGIGKSSLAAKFPNPVFIDTEGSTDKLEVNRMKKPSSWTELIQMLDWIKNQRQFSSVIIDTADWAQRLAEQEVCQQHGVQSIADIGYGNGYVYMKDKFGNFLDKMQDMADAGINAVLTAHSQITKFEDPGEMGAYDRYELKLAKRSNADVAGMAKEWADTVLFLNYRVISVKADEAGKKFKAQGGQRVMHTTHRPAWDAKNRDSLPEEITLDYSAIAHVIPDMVQAPPVQQPQTPVVGNEPVLEKNDTPPTQETVNNVEQSLTGVPPEYLPKALRDLMISSNVTEDELHVVAGIRGHFPIDTDFATIAQTTPEYFTGGLVANWQPLLQVIGEFRGNRQVVEDLWMKVVGDNDVAYDKTSDMNINWNE